MRLSSKCKVVHLTFRRERFLGSFATGSKLSNPAYQQVFDEIEQHLKQKYTRPDKSVSFLHVGDLKADL